MMEKYLLTLFASFGVSSMVMYSELFAGFREWWLKHFRGCRKAESFIVCQLCISFWVAFMVKFAYDVGSCKSMEEMFIAIDEGSFVIDFIWAAGIAGLSWMMGAFTLACLWLKALLEKTYTEE